MFTPPSISGRLPYKDAKPQDTAQQETASVDAAEAATADGAVTTAFYQLSTDTVVGLSDRIQLLLSAHDAELQRVAKEAAQNGQNTNKANSNPLGLKPGKTLLESVGGNAALAAILSRYQARAQVSTDNSFFADYAKVMPLVSMRVHANDVNAPSRGAAWHLAHCIDSDEVLDRTLTHLTTISHLVGAAVNHEVVHCTPRHIDDEILLNTSDIFAKMPTWTLTLDVSDCPECAPVTGIMVSRIVLIKPEEHVKHLPTYSDTQTIKHGQPFAEFLAVSISQNNKLFTPINHPLILDAENCVNDAIATAFLPQKAINAARQGQSQQTPAPSAKEQAKATGDAKAAGNDKSSGDAKKQADNAADATTSTATAAAKPAVKAKAKAKAGQGKRGQGSKQQQQQKQHKPHTAATHGAPHGAKAAQAHTDKAQHSLKSNAQAPQAGKKKARVASAAKAFARKAKEAQAEKNTAATEAKSSTTTVNADAAVGAELKASQLTAQQKEQQHEQKKQSASTLGLNLEPVTVPQEATPAAAAAANAAVAETAPASVPAADTSTNATATAQPTTAADSSATALGLSLEAVTVPTATAPQPEATAAAAAEDNAAAANTLGLGLELAPVTVPTADAAPDSAAAASSTSTTSEDSAAPATVPPPESSAAHSDAQDTAALTTMPEPSEAHQLNLSLEPVTVAGGNLPETSDSLSAGDSTESLSKDALFGGFTADAENSTNLSLATAATDNASAADSTAPKAKDASEQVPAKPKKAQKPEVDADHAFEEVVHPELRRKPLINGMTEALKYVLYFITHQDELKDAHGNSGAVLRNPQAPLSVQKLWQEDKLLAALAEPWDDYVL